MNSEYFILEQGQRMGPYNMQGLMDRPLEPDDVVLLPSQTQGIPAYTMPEFDAYFKSEGIYYPTKENTAGFFIRFAAYMIDILMMSIVASFIIGLFFPEYLIEMQKYTDYKAMNAHVNLLPFQLSVIAFRTLYFSFCESTKLQGSLGKVICGLAVVDESGYTVTFLQAFKRNAGRIVSETFFCIGYISIFVLERHQAMHDQFAKCFVVVKRR